MAREAGMAQVVKFPTPPPPPRHQPNIAYLRAARGLTQARLAERMRVDENTIARWESGKAVPSDDQKLDLADLFGVGVIEMMAWDFDPDDGPGDGIRIAS